jgi:hypothetical protein
MFTLGCLLTRATINPCLHVCSDLNLEFEVPFRELGFHGVPHRTNSFIMPTVNCLVELTEYPFTVITLGGAKQLLGLVAGCGIAEAVVGSGMLSSCCARPYCAEVNLVNLERVGFNLRNFDMVFIWKDLNKDVGRIDSIPSTSLDTIKARCCPQPHAHPH